MGAALSRRLARTAVPAVAVGLAVVLLAGLVAAALRPGTASAATVLQRGQGVVVQEDDGSSRPLRVGQEVPRGSLVVAAADGAVLRTRGRDTWLGGGASVLVLDGARQELRGGLVMVDARRGPGLRLSTASADVTTPDGAVSRVEGGPLLRVGAYDGDPLSVQPAGRGAVTPVARAYQVQVPEGSLPGRVTPLVLTAGDAYERALAPVLVAADEALGDVAERLDSEGAPAVAVRTAADADVPLSAVPAAVPAGAPVSERALAYLLARAAGGQLADRYAEVRRLRGYGGSWGVVSELVSAPVTAVAGLLDELLAPAAATQAAAPLDLPTLLELVGAAPATAPATPPATPGAPAGAPDPGSAPAEPADPPPSSPPPAGPLPLPDASEPVTLVGTVVDTVLGLLPSAPASEPAPGASAPQPAPQPSSAPTPLLPLLPLPLLTP